MRPARWVVLYLTLVLLAISSPAWQGAGSASAAKSAKSAANSKSAAAAPAGVIDINHASKDDLKTLSGIGDAYANAIIRNRPYKNKAQLKSRNVIPDATYNKIKDKVIAKQ
ncbi:MAG TPA: helix-hairpin-helix domain-containing protein [Bryobacteraceae bacterium]|nr:helix-hairpin-helix domain-containing protein [Bryobacteraceae bacterium]